MNNYCDSKYTKVGKPLASYTVVPQPYTSYTVAPRPCFDPLVIFTEAGIEILREDSRNLTVEG